MNTLQKDLDAQNWAIVGPRLLKCLKAFCDHPLIFANVLSFHDEVSEAEEAIKQAEALNV